MNIVELPNEIKRNIFIFLIPNNDCDIISFLLIRLVNNEFKNLIDNIELWIEYSKYLGIYNMLNYNLIGIKKSYLEYNSYLNLKKFIFDKKEIMEFHQYLDIYLKFKYLIKKDIINFETLIKLPVCKFKSSKCIDNNCSNECYNNNHGIIHFITHRLMRGIDNKNRPFLLFFYKNMKTNINYYEFIYLEKKINLIRAYYSGIYNNMYIGLLSDSRIYNNRYYSKNLCPPSLNYMQRLINENGCGSIKYNYKTDSYYEYLEEKTSIHIDN